MRVLSLCPILLVCTVAAQSIEIYPGATGFTSRGSLGVNSGELAQGFHRSHWRAIGTVGEHGWLSGLRYVLQDQNAATQSAYEVVIRQGADGAGPTLGNGGVLCHAGPLMLPIGTGPIAFLITTRFSQPCLLPNDGFVAAAVRLGPSPAWPGDGLSVHMALAATQSGPQRQDHAWEWVAGASTFTHPTPELSWRVALLTATPVVQNGVFATGTRAYSRGVGGMFPPVATHGWSTHVDGGPAFSRGIARVFLTGNLLPQPIVAPFVRGAVYLGPDAIPLATLFLDQDGRSDLPVIDPILQFGLTAWVQAVLIDNSLIHIATTNANASTFQ